MKLHVLNYALQENVDAELDDPSVDLESMASPQFACVCTEENLAEAIEDLKQAVEDELLELDIECDDWTDTGWHTPVEGGRPNRSLFVIEDGEILARIVIQEVEAFTA